MMRIPLIQTPRLRAAALLLGCLLAGSATLPAVELYTSNTEEPEPRRTELTVQYGNVDFDEVQNEAMVREVLGIEDKPKFGLGRFYWENEASNEWRVYLDGSYLKNPDNFKLTYELHNGNNTFFDLNFQHWKEYDFPGELYYPPTEGFYLLSASALEEEINKLDLSLRLHPSDTVRLRVKYSFFERRGSSLSTIFGDDYQYLIRQTTSRNIVPALIEGTERVHTADISLTREEEMDRVGVRFHYQKRRVERQHVVERAAEQASANRYTTQETDSEDDLFAFSAFNRKQMNDKLVGSVGFAFTRLDGDLTGSRIFGANPEAQYDVDFPNRQLNDRGYLDLENQRKLKQWILNANAVYTPSETVRWMTGIRVEHLSTESSSFYIDTFKTVDWNDLEFENQQALANSGSEKSALDLSAFLEGRYTGIKKLLLYSRVEGSAQDGDLEEHWSRQEVYPDTGSAIDLLDRATDFEREKAFWEAGANYALTPKLRISLEGYLKYARDSYDWGGVDLDPDDYTAYPGFVKQQVVKTRDINARVHWRLHSALKSVTRVDAQVNTIDSESPLTPQIRSSERERVMFSQSLVWTPHPRIFLSGSASVVEDLTETPAADLQGTFSGILIDLPNDYWQADLNLYYVLSKLVDVQLAYQYLEMDQFIDNSPRTVAYGTDLEQQHAMARFIFHLSDRAVARIGYNIYKRDEPSAAGFKDYEVHVINGSLQVFF